MKSIEGFDGWDDPEALNFLRIWADVVDRRCPIVSGVSVAEVPRLNSRYLTTGTLIELTCSGAVADIDSIFGRKTLVDVCNRCGVRR